MRLEAAKPPAPAYFTDGDLPDVNVWLSLAVQEHPHHAMARAYWERHPAPKLWFTRVTMLALVRLLCAPKVMGTAVLDLPSAFEIYRRFAELPEVGLRPEPDACETALKTLVSAPPSALPSRLWIDAYLAAFAIDAGLRLVTFDRDFDRFKGLNCLRLNTAAA